MPRPDLAELIARLEAATEGSGELDIEICKALGQPPEGQEREYRVDPHGFAEMRWKTPPQMWSSFYRVDAFTHSLDAALSLVPENISYELAFSAAGEGAMRRARLWDWRRGPLMIDPKNEWAAEARTLPLALSAAALRARLSAQPS